MPKGIPGSGPFANRRKPKKGGDQHPTTPTDEERLQALVQDMFLLMQEGMKRLVMEMKARR